MGLYKCDRQIALKRKIYNLTPFVIVRVIDKRILLITSLHVAHNVTLPVSVEVLDHKYTHISRSHILIAFSYNMEYYLPDRP